MSNEAYHTRYPESGTGAVLRILGLGGQRLRVNEEHTVGLDNVRYHRVRIFHSEE